MLRFILSIVDSSLSVLDTYREIGTSSGTEITPDTLLRVSNNGFLILHLQNTSGTELNTYTAAFAPLRENMHEGIGVGSEFSLRCFLVLLNLAAVLLAGGGFFRRRGFLSH